MRCMLTVAICIVCFSSGAQTRKSYISLYTSVANEAQPGISFTKISGGPSYKSFE